MTIISEKIPRRTKAIGLLTATLISTTAIATSSALADKYKFSPGELQKVVR